MKKIHIGTVCAAIGVVLSLLKLGGIALTTWSWWLVTAPIWGPVAAFVVFMLFVYLIVGVRSGVDKTAEQVFDKDDDRPFTEEEHRRFSRWLEEYGDI